MVRLPLARKAMLVTFLAIVTMAGAIHAMIYVFVLRNVERLEREEIHQRVESVRHVVGLISDDLARNGRDWSDWDELYAYVQGNDPQFSARKLNYASFASTEWDLCAVLAADGRLVWGGRADHAKQEMAQLSDALVSSLKSDKLRSESDPNRAITSFIMSDGQLYLLASRAIRKTAPQQEPVAGRLVYARVINDAWTERLRQFTLTHVELRNATSPAVDEFEQEARNKLAVAPTKPVEILSSKRESRGYLFLTDLDGRPLILLEVRTERRLGPMGQRIVDSTLAALAIGGFALLVAAFVIVRHGIISPLSKLRDAVRKLEQGQHSAVILNREDELGELASGFNRMARTMRERETTLRQAHAELKLILDSTADTLCGCTLTGSFRGKPSAMGPKWFGEPQPDQDVPTWLFGNHPSLIAFFRLGLAQVVDEKLPLPVALDQLPQRFSRDKSSYDIVYRPIREGDDIIGLLLVIKDVTAKMRAESAEREAREMQIVIGNMLRDRAAFDHFVEECEGLLQEMSTETNLSNRLVHLHTLKGACSIFGLLSFSEACQTLEAQIAVNAEALNEEALRTLRRSFQSTLNRVKRLAPSLGDKRLSISLADYSNFVELLEKRLGHERLLAEAIRLPLESGERLLGKLVQHAHRIAQELGKTIEVEVDDGGLRLVTESTQLLWSALVHGVRNAIEHGIESEAERLRLGKSPNGNLRIVMREKGHHLAVSIIDDGRGIDWATLEKRAYSSRLPSTREDLVELLFTDGLSTKAQTPSISGRGIGLSAIRATCHALGGTCIVYAGPNGVGTELYCTISMTVATHPPPTRPQIAASHSRLSVGPSAIDAPEQQAGTPSMEKRK